MQLPVTIKSALISVYYKDQLEPLIRKLDALGVTIYSTGGTGKFIADLGVQVEMVEDLTSYPSILGGRVKTLHPKVFGGILARRDMQEDTLQLDQFGIPPIDLVIVDLYPFEETVQATDDEPAIIEKIDIGGVSLIRAAAKNFKDVVIISSKNEYAELLAFLETQSGETTLSQRKYFAKKAFEVTAHYDQAIYTYFNHNENFHFGFAPKIEMRYGENPHQQAAFFGKLNSVFDKLHGKEISYNNLVDIESCVYLMEEFKSETAAGHAVFAIIKHTNACGLAVADSLESAWDKALGGDPVSAFGGVLISNTVVDLPTANKINELFFEVLIAPGFDAEALTILQTKKNRILLKQLQFDFPSVQFKSLLNGVIVQDRNTISSEEQQLQFVTDKKPGAAQIEDLLFAEKAVKHLKSNGIVLVKQKQLIGCGTGQTSRVDALNQAIVKARAFGFDIHGAAMASEAFFPFPDCVEIAWNAGVTAVIQPGGSVRDQESIAFCNAHGLAMVTTGLRHFKH